MPWLQIVDDWTDLPGHKVGEALTSAAATRFREEFAGRYVFGSEPEEYETSCGAAFVWMLMDGRVKRMLEECGVPSNSRVAVCPHEVQHISYTPAAPLLGEMALKRGTADFKSEQKDLELITPEFTLVGKRKFRH